MSDITSEIKDEIMTKEESIIHIENLYPIDCDYERTNMIGRELLIEVILEYGWRDLPDEILLKLAELCLVKSDNSHLL